MAIDIKIPICAVLIVFAFITLCVICALRLAALYDDATAEAIASDPLFPSAPAPRRTRAGGSAPNVLSGASAGRNGRRA